MAFAIPPPHVLFAPGSSSLFDVPRPGAPVPFPHPRLLHPDFVLVFCYITFLSIYVFFEFFCSFCRSSLRWFRCPSSIPELLLHPHRDELPSCSSLYGVNVHAIGFFPCISFLLVFSYVAFLFPVFHLLFACNNALASMIRLDPL
jgi:hypothetical protein